MRPYNEFSSTRGYCCSKPVPIINPITLQIVVDNNDSLEGAHPTPGQVMGYNGTNVVWGNFGSGGIPTLQQVLDTGNYANQYITLGDDISGSATITNKMTDSGLVVTDDNLISNIGIQLIHQGLVFSRKNEQTPLTAKVSNTDGGTIRYTKMDASLLNNGVECYFKNNVVENKAFLSQTGLVFDTSSNTINRSTYYKNDGFSIHQNATVPEIKADISNTSFTVSDISGSFIATPSSMKVGGTKYFELSANAFLQMSLSGDTGTSGQIITHDGSGVVWGDLSTIIEKANTVLNAGLTGGPYSLAYFEQNTAGAYSRLSSDTSNNQLFYDPSNNVLTISNGTNTNQMNASGYTTRNSIQNSTHYLNFSDNSATATGAIQKTSGLSCNPSAKSITATTFIGDLSGTTSLVQISNNDTSGNYFLTFVDGSGNKPLYIDNSNTPFTYNPSTSTLSATTFSGNNFTTLVGNMNISASGSTGSGDIILTPKEVGTISTLKIPRTTNPNDMLVIEKRPNFTEFFQTGGATNTNTQMRLGTGGLRLVTINSDSPNFQLDNESFASAQHKYLGTTYNLNLPNSGKFSLTNGSLDLNGQSIQPSIGDATIDTSTSTGSGDINITTTSNNTPSTGGVITVNSRNQLTTTTNDIVFQNGTTNTLTHSDASGWDFQANNITTTGDISCNTLYYTSLSPGPSLQSVLTNGNTASGTTATIDLTNTGVGGLANPQLTLTNSNASINTIPTIKFNKTGRNLTPGETVASISMYGLDAGAQETEFAKIQVKTENVASGNEDGTLSIFTAVNGLNSEVFNFNGGQNENNSFRPLDMNGNNIRTSTGNLTIDASGSALGIITINSKQQATNTTNDMVFKTGTTNTLTHSDASGWDFQANNITTSIGDLSLNATGSTGTGNINLTAKTGANINLNSNVLMDGGENISIRNVGNTLYNNSTQTGVSMADNTNNTNLKTHILTNTLQQITNTQPSANRYYVNESDADLTGIREVDYGTGVDINRLGMSFNGFNIVNSSNPSNGERVDINATTIQFTSSGSANDSLSMYNDSADGGEIDWSNVTGTNGLTITSSHSLTLKSTTATYPLQLDSDVINLVNTNTTASASNHNADIRATSAGLESTTFLKLQLNGANIWIPYFTTDPSA